MKKLDRIIKTELTLFQKNDCIFKGMGFPVVMFRYECCTIKKKKKTLSTEKLMFSNSDSEVLLRVSWTKGDEISEF